MADPSNATTTTQEAVRRPPRVHDGRIKRLMELNFPVAAGNPEKRECRWCGGLYSVGTGNTTLRGHLNNKHAGWDGSEGDPNALHLGLGLASSSSTPQTGHQPSKRHRSPSSSSQHSRTHKKQFTGTMADLAHLSSTALSDLTAKSLQHFTAKELCQLSELSADEYQARLKVIQNKKGFIIDMDGVIYHGNVLLPGVKDFIHWLKKEDKKFLFLTNNSAPTPRELSFKLARLGLSVTEDHFYTSAIATAKFLQSQKPNGGTVYVVGEPGLIYALYEVGFSMNETNPDYVVIGEGSSQTFDKISKAVNLVYKGAKLIGTNPDVNGPTEGGIAPATGAFCAAVELASGRKAFYLGKPTSLMLRYAATILGTSKDETCIIGDRMDTDILSGVYAEIDPVLVMSGVSRPEDVRSQAYRPWVVCNGVGEVVPREA
ncbi:HAD-like domain-containing protein [Fimicolochytrium jonesii]|uniref:HAD-like domain-containing protein n=1 Tax=Fimicolochytrium jonesii TaxID=1396493 RepID=UPI0022FE4741|nr:HAD-like domain-containing protein [Fimicolochytrium jonesii]KAI8820431.1 HAD-like domain-containing protein [Fimicolochytrium jonesii]